MRFAGSLWSLAAFAVVAVFGFSACQTGPAGPANANAPKPLAATGPTPSSSPLSPTIPGDANFSDNPSTIQQIQHDFDVFSWQSFVALNWPLDQSQTIGSAPDGDNPSV
jgi:hypothetical protein